jgi:hypothetical protein
LYFKIFSHDFKITVQVRQLTTEKRDLATQLSVVQSGGFGGCVQITSA